MSKLTGLFACGGTTSHTALSRVLTAADREAIEAAAKRAGFDAAGVAAVPLPDSPEDRLQRERFREWVDAGRAGEMGWLTRTDADGEFVRSSLHRAVPWVRSVVICAKTYHADAPLSTASAPEGSGWIGRYAWSGAASVPGQAAPSPSQATANPGQAASESGQAARAPGSKATTSTLRPTDYHEVLLTRLRRVEAELQARLGGAIQTRCYVDTGPVVERFLAQLAGVGWIGKNTCVLDQKLGSFLLLGVVLTSLPLAPEAVLLPSPDRCGTCTRCIDACPTDALVAPRQMDASRCISYLTIEKKGEIPEALRAGMGRQVFGCDICQDVCPWNRRAPIGSDSEMQPRPELINPSLEWLASLDSAGFQKTFRGSPLERTGRRRLQRNVAIAMGNSGKGEHAARLQIWVDGDDPILAEAAAWALRRLPGADALPRPGSPEDSGTASPLPCKEPAALC